MQLSLSFFCWFIALILLWQRKPCNALIQKLCLSCKEWRARQSALPEDSALALIEKISNGVRAGGSLSAHWREAGEAQGTLSPEVVRLLEYHVSTGSPALVNLAAIKRQYGRMRKAKWRARALSAQARAQSTILGAFPYLLLPLLFLVDPEGAIAAFSHLSSVLALAMAAILGAFGRYWTRHQTEQAVDTNGKHTQGAKALTETLLSLSATIRAGLSPSTAFGEGALKKKLDTGKGSTSQALWCRLESLLDAHQRDGIPILSELELLLEEVQVEMESRMEERLQTLPVSLLLPLFLCQLPAALLILVAYLSPQFSQWGG